MKNKYPGEMIDPRIFEEQAKQSQQLDKGEATYSPDLTKITATPGATAESQGWDENNKPDHEWAKDIDVVDTYTLGKDVDLNKLPATIEDDGDTLTMFLPKNRGGAYAECSDPGAKILHLDFGEPPIFSPMDLYVEHYGPFDYSLEAEAAKVDKEVRAAIFDDLQQERRANLHLHHGSFAGDGFIPPEDFNVNPGTPYIQRPLNDDELQKLREVVEGDNDGKPVKVAILGAPRLQAEYIIAACKDAGIEVTQRAAYDESDLIGDIDMKMLSTAALGMKHLSANPYSDGRKPHVESEIDSNRKLDRTRQKNLNKKQGYGKRLTKKDRLAQETKSNYTETYVVERTDILEVDPSTGITKVIK